jgi:ankyrin repeat protein
MSFQKKYLKYKNKYLDLKSQIGGSNPNSPRASAGGGGSNPNSPRASAIDSKSLIDYIREGNVEKVKALIERGINVNNEIEGQTPLMIASEFGQKAVVECLIDHCRADVNFQTYTGTALMYACINGEKDVVDALIIRKADVNLQDDYRNTALMFACTNGNIEIVNTLILNNAKLDIQNRTYLQTALIIASKAGNTGIVNALINAGANVNLQDRAIDNHENQNAIGNTALMHAIIRGHNDITISLIIANGANLEICNWDNYNALLLACEYGREEIVANLLEHGVDMNVLTIYHGYSPITIALKNRHSRVLRMLITYRPDLIDFGDMSGETCLMYASQYGDLPLIQFLIERGANVDLQDDDGYSALMHASMNSNQEVVLELLNNRANTDLKSNDNETALDLATNPDIIKLLRTYGKGRAIYGVLDELNIGHHLDIPDIKELLAHVNNEFSPIIRDLNDAIAFINNQDYKIDDIFKLEPTFINIQTRDLGKEFDKTLDDFKRERNEYNLNKLLKISLLQLVLKTRYDNPPLSHNELREQSERYVLDQVDIPNVREFLASVYNPLDDAISFINDERNTINDIFTLDTSLITTQNNSRYLDKLFNDALSDYKKEQNEYKLNKLLKISLLQLILDSRKKDTYPSQEEMIASVNRYVNSRIQFM